jgi:hypothetical protein
VFTNGFPRASRPPTLRQRAASSLNSGTDRTVPCADLRFAYRNELGHAPRSLAQTKRSRTAGRKPQLKVSSRYGVHPDQINASIGGVGPLFAKARVEGGSERVGNSALPVTSAWLAHAT